MARLESLGVSRRWLLAVLRWIGLAPSALSLAEGRAAYRRGDYSAALQALLPAAEAGDGDAQYCIATLYRDGNGTPQDEATAVHWYRRAAEREHVEAQFELGRAYEEGTVVPQDDGEAARWYEQAARHGHSKAQYLLGVMYMTGRGVAADPVEAYAWLGVAEKDSSDSVQQASEKLAELARTMTPAQTAEAQRHLVEISEAIR